MNCNHKHRNHRWRISLSFIVFDFFETKLKRKINLKIIEVVVKIIKIVLNSAFQLNCLWLSCNIVFRTTIALSYDWRRENNRYRFLPKNTAVLQKTFDAAKANKRIIFLMHIARLVYDRPKFLFSLWLIPFLCCDNEAHHFSKHICKFVYKIFNAFEMIVASILNSIRIQFIKQILCPSSAIYIWICNNLEHSLFSTQIFTSYMWSRFPIKSYFKIVWSKKLTWISNTLQSSIWVCVGFRIINIYISMLV